MTPFMRSCTNVWLYYFSPHQEEVFEAAAAGMTCSSSCPQARKSLATRSRDWLAVVTLVISLAALIEDQVAALRARAGPRPCGRSVSTQGETEASRQVCMSYLKGELIFFIAPERLSCRLPLRCLPSENLADCRGRSPLHFPVGP